MSATMQRAEWVAVPDRRIRPSSPRWRLWLAVTRRAGAVLVLAAGVGVPGLAAGPADAVASRSRTGAYPPVADEAVGLAGKPVVHAVRTTASTPVRPSVEATLQPRLGDLRLGWELLFSR